jgi:peroxiredoxin
MTLNAELRALYEARFPQLPADVRPVMETAASDLAGSGITDRALAVGAHAPEFTLPAATGDPVTLSKLLVDGPVVLTFYRGGWCPYCNLALRALQQQHAEIAARGARLVAVSPQVPDESLSLSEKHELAFDVLSDVGSEVATAYGIAFDLSEELSAAYERLGIDLQRVNGGHARTLPLPATFVIDPGGIVRWRFVETDYTERAEPAAILAALDDLR